MAFTEINDVFVNSTSPATTLPVDATGASKVSVSVRNQSDAEVSVMPQGSVDGGAWYPLLESAVDVSANSAAPANADVMGFTWVRALVTTEAVPNKLISASLSTGL
jgi:hypothetical protein